MRGDLDLVDRAIAVLRGLEPKGLAAANAIEAMLAQLAPADPDTPMLGRLLQEFLEPIARNALPRVARELAISIEKLKALIERLSRLQPRPAAALCEVRDAVRAVFAAENRRAPLSDDDAVEELKKRGLALARRTVAKYRRELGIQSSYRRRLYGCA